ncbi:hypothetical protein S83_055910, partial [Arachis hypogaea]
PTLLSPTNPAASVHLAHHRCCSVAHVAAVAQSLTSPLSLIDHVAPTSLVVVTLLVAHLSDWQSSVPPSSIAVLPHRTHVAPISLVVVTLLIAHLSDLQSSVPPSSVVVSLVSSKHSSLIHYLQLTSLLLCFLPSPDFFSLS